MKRNALLLGLLASACGGKTTPTETLGDSHATASGTATTPNTSAKADPNLPFRLAYSNAGGMWLPQQMTLPGHIETFKKMGVPMDASVLADPLAAPLAAVVSLGGCTASFVSADGLIVTNHHCVQGALQHNSTEKSNLVENGFLAKTRAEEPSAGPSQRVFVAQAFKDVSKDMRDGLDAIKDPIKRKDEVDKRLKTLIAACEKDRAELRCDVKSYYRGGMYLLIENLEIKDVRLAYVPPRSVGNYGGEIDNWAWPRHTGDFAFYRAYVGKDGKPADYSPDNVPFKPKHFLKVSSKGVKPGDFVMVTGYPGSTTRTKTALETRNDVEWAFPYLIAYYKERYALAESHLKDGGETSIKATVMKQGIQNGVEKYQGILEGLKKNEELMQRKEALDKQVKAWAEQPGHEAHKANIAKLEQIVLEEQRTQRVDFDRAVALGGSRLLGTALSFTRWAEERAKKNVDRKPGYQDRDLPRSIAGQKSFAKSYDRTLDRAGFRLSLLRALQLEESQRPWLVTLLGVKKGTKVDEALIDKTLETWYAGQTLEDEKLRIELLQSGTTKQLKASKDPFIKAALRVWPIIKADEKKTDARGGELLLVTPSYAEGMKQVLGGLLPPDANSTLRITYGTVKSFKPGSKEQADWPFTTATQMLAKDTGKEPFDAPKKLLDAVRAKKFGPYGDPALGGELAVDFLSDLDITGGNSGSPTLNDKGELVGLAFDGTTEGLASDVVFNGATTRVIHADARYMLWNMDLLDGADHLLKEMGITPSL
ncbi:MAG: S46 family peptidase [Deltaproteobacteria bacterium]|nr:S46 family peptidase [Deltaproteobacteria bacterium]